MGDKRTNQVSLLCPLQSFHHGSHHYVQAYVELHAHTFASSLVFPFLMLNTTCVAIFSCRMESKGEILCACLPIIEDHVYHI